MRFMKGVLSMGRGGVEAKDVATGRHEGVAKKMEVD